MLPFSWLNYVFLIFFGVPHLATYLSLFSIEPELGTEIDPGMVMTPFPSSILVETRQDLNPQPMFVG
jgi:hypothetical protein